MRLEPLPSHPLCHHKAFAESVSIHPDMGAAGAAAIPGEKGKRTQFIRHNSLNALQPERTPCSHGSELEYESILHTEVQRSNSG